MIIDTKYRYQQDWQYQTIKLDTSNLNIIRSQNFMTPEGMQHTTDVIRIGDRGWDGLFRQYGYPALIEHNKKDK